MAGLKTYAGRTADERAEGRRARLMDTGLELFGTLGWAGTTVERVCSAAAVSPRHFYAAFTSREDLLLAVYRDIVTGTTAAVLAAVGPVRRPGPVTGEEVRAGVLAYVRDVTADPRRARVAHREVRASGALEDQRRDTVVTFAALIAREARPTGRLTALALAGAVNELLTTWTVDADPPSVADLEDELVSLFLKVLLPA